MPETGEYRQELDAWERSREAARRIEAERRPPTPEPELPQGHIEGWGAL